MLGNHHTRAEFRECGNGQQQDTTLNILIGKTIAGDHGA
jgi:hypothetical protein